jgi:exopolysaccharide biosynthesis protein
MISVVVNNMGKILSRISKLTLDKDVFMPTNEMYRVYRRSSVNSIASGSLSSIYDVIEDNRENRRRIVKITRACESTLNVNVELCKILSESDSIIKVPYNDDILYMIPNSLSEGIISGILNEGVFGRECPFFGKTLGIFYSETDRTTYSFMDKYYSKIDEVINRQMIFSHIAYYILFQITYALAKAQERYELTHYDLHTGNIVFERKDHRTDTFKYNIRTSQTGGNTFEISTLIPFNVRIIDFGFARIKRENVMIHPRVGINRVVDIYSVFNPCYDLTSFIGIILYISEHPFSFTENIRDIAVLLLNFIGKNQMIDILRYMYNITDPSFDYHSLYYNRSWRPLHVTKYHRDAKNMYEMSSYFFNLFEQSAPQNFTRITRSVFLNINKLYRRKHYAIGIPENLLVLNRFHYLENGFILYNLDPQDILRNWVLLRSLKPYYHHTFGNTDNHTPKQIITVIFLDSQKLLYDGYSFKTTCCKIDPKDFMKSYKGVAINGGFFDIRKTFRPIGPYRQTNNNNVYESYIEIPKLYTKDYGVVIFGENSTSIRLTTYNEFIRNNHIEENIFVSGPMLIRNGNVIFNHEKIVSHTTYEGNTIYPYQCRTPISGEPPSKFLLTQDNMEQEDGYIPNCQQGLPGELSHASNPNPRSMLIKRRPDFYGDYAFVVVEGRNNRGDGVDLELLTQIAKYLGAIDAINLDGGKSSTLAWNFNGEVYTNNNQSIEKYVAGNILAMIKTP